MSLVSLDEQIAKLYRIAVVLKTDRPTLRDIRKPSIVDDGFSVQYDGQPLATHGDHESVESTTFPGHAGQRYNTIGYVYVALNRARPQPMKRSDTP
jgi:hypothetical protein